MIKDRDILEAAILEVSDVKKLRALEEENRRLKEMVADLSLDKAALTTVIRKNVWSAAGLQLKTSMTGWFAQMYSAFQWASPGHDEKFARGCPNNGCGLKGRFFRQASATPFNCSVICVFDCKPERNRRRRAVGKWETRSVFQAGAASVISTVSYAAVAMTGDMAGR
jgi:hypothetical protein